MEDITAWMIDLDDRQDELTEIDLIINELLLEGEYESQ